MPIAVAILSVLSALAPQEARPFSLGFSGLHGGVAEAFTEAAGSAIRVVTYSDAEIAAGRADLGSCDLLLVQHLREEDLRSWKEMIRAAVRGGRKLHILPLGAFSDEFRAAVGEDGELIDDPEPGRYYRAGGRENLRRLSAYLLARYGKRPVAVEPPIEEIQQGFWHPEAAGLFADRSAFEAWSREHGRDPEGRPRALVAVHWLHLAHQQPAVAEAIVRALEAKGILAAAIVDGSPAYEAAAKDFGPDLVIHLCHSQESSAFREELGVPHLHSLFFNRHSIEEWRSGNDGLAAHEVAFQITSQEPRGSTEFLAGAGTPQGGGSGEALVPIGDRIERLAERASAWIRLRRLPNAEKRLAVIYYDREMGKSELGRGSATGMFLNAPKSLMRLLEALRSRGWSIDSMPRDERELIDAMRDHGRQIGPWAEDELDRLAAGGMAALIPVERYRAWYEARVPASIRRELESRWGPPPGRIMVRRVEGVDCLVIPKLDFGNLTFLPQPLRGEAHDVSLVHDRLVPPTHQYLATYFWLEEERRVDAMIHFGTHGTEFLLPGRPTALSATDWTDIVIGRTPNIQPWILNNLGESLPARRRSRAVLVDHLTPPLASAALSDELERLHDDIDRFESLEPGVLKQRFRESISRDARSTGLATDLALRAGQDGLLDDTAIGEVAGHLHRLHEEKVPTRLHVLGEAPGPDEIVPWITTCLRRHFLDAIAKLIDVPESERTLPGDADLWLRSQAEALVDAVIRRGCDDREALSSLGVPAGPVPPEIAEDLSLARRLAEGLSRTGDEVGHLLDALEGRFVPPGPGGGPDRHPAALPTGRNLFVLDPETIPARASFELGRQLADALLEGRRTRNGRLPERVAFDLSSFATLQDYGVMESQILWLLGCRPIWDSRDMVQDVEPVPLAELGRPRIDVFLSLPGNYRDVLESRMKLLDRAIARIADLDEDGNAVAEHSKRAERKLLAAGSSPEASRRLSRARIFGPPPGETGSAGYYYLVERSGTWDTREELAQIHLEHIRFAYTEGAWGEESAAAFNEAIADTSVVVRTWVDATTSPVSNKYFWYRGGSLSMAIRTVTGKEPEFLLSDVRDPDRAAVVDSSEALTFDIRARLLNRRWIEGMMKEGYAGADQLAVAVSNAFGWSTMRPGSVRDDVWVAIHDTIVRDGKQLGLADWFAANNPHARQEILELELEAIRKGFWAASQETREELAAEWRDSVRRFGEDGGLFGGGNEKLERFVTALIGPTVARADEPPSDPAPSSPAEHEEPQSPTPESRSAADVSGDAQGETEAVEGPVLEPRPAVADESHRVGWFYGLGGAIVAAIVIGAWRRTGALR